MITKRMTMGNVGMMTMMGNVGAPPVPAAHCYDDPTFEQAWLAAAESAAQQASTDAEFDAIMEANLDQLCGTGTRDPVGPGLPQAGKPCDSYQNRLAAQILLADGGFYKDTLDGLWGKNSAAALKASGQTFESLVPGCTPPAPTYSASGGGTGPGPGPGGGGGTNVNIDQGTAKTSYAWLYGVGAVVLGLGVAVAVTRKDKQPYAQ